MNLTRTGGYPLLANNRSSAAHILHVWLLLLIPMLLLLSGCGSESPPQATTIADSYPGQLENVSSIVIVDGETGARRRMQDPAFIRNWLADVSGLELLPDPDQEERDGFLIAAALYEGDDKKLSFTPVSVQGAYYLYNEQLHERMEDLFSNGE